MSLEPSPTRRSEGSGKDECETTGAEEGHEVPSGKVGGGIRFDSIEVGKSGRD